MDNWQPIEAAPKDGAEVIVMCPVDGVVSSKYLYGCWQKLTVCYPPGNEPTH